MEKTISSINTIKYLDHNGDYKIKLPGAKEFKTYKFTYQKEDMKNAKKKIRTDIADLRKKKESLVKDYQQLFILKIKKGEISISKKEKMMIEIKNLTDKITMLESVLSSIGNVPPSDMRYTNRKIILK